MLNNKTDAAVLQISPGAEGNVYTMLQKPSRCRPTGCDPDTRVVGNDLYVLISLPFLRTDWSRLNL